MSDVLLTADKTLMSNYHNNEFLGFGTCAPPNFVPEWLYSYLFFPPLQTSSGRPWTAPYGLRKIEAQLLKEGFNVDTVSPNHMGNSLKDAKVLGIYAMDPFGLGPASTTLASIFKKEPYLAKHFQTLLKSPAIKKAKQNGVKVIVGGPGAWQFRYRKRAAKDLGINCIVEGEAENVIGKLFKAAIEGQEIPDLYEVAVGEVPRLEEIPDIVGPSINGLIEIGRGCCRSCQFCNVTLRPLRWYPIEKVERELNVNLDSGKVYGACLHSEDVMLYGLSNTVPNDDKLVDLHELVMKKVDSISWSHCSLAAVASAPKLFRRYQRLFCRNRHGGAQKWALRLVLLRLLRRLCPQKLARLRLRIGTT
jgi:radical SAM superfamily enzyme YgiQ (UPF0313 family)